MSTFTCARARARAAARLLLVCALALAAAAGCSDSGSSTPDAGVDGARDVVTPDAPDTDGAVVTAREKQDFEALMTFAQQHIASVKAPGAAIAVLLRGKLAFARGVGVKREGQNDPVSETTLFSLASLSKVITAATALSLVEDGTVTLQDSADKHLPAIKLAPPSDAAKVTLEMLLSHTSGITNIAPTTLGNVGLDFDSPDVLAKAFEAVDWPMWAPPGAVWNYSNRGYSLAGAMLARAASKPFAELVKARVFDVLSMSGATLSEADAAKADHTAGHGASQAGGPIEPGSQFVTGYLDEPNDGVYASVTDVARFCEALLGDGGAMLPKARVDQLTARAVDLADQLDGYGYGFGLYRIERGGKVQLEHSGGNQGWSANVVLVPDEGFAVVALVNHAGGQPWVLTSRAHELFAKTLDRPKPFTRLTVAELEKLAGSYTDASGRLGKITLATNGKDGQLSATLGNNAPTVMAQNGPYFFSVVVPGIGGVTVQVYRDSAGQGEYLVTRVGVAKRD
ncbi:MAG: beta-lactamase family protein [Myxococcales bacterium]|nr:beta-lactamase family protein [Myxococcales bacterium]